MSNGRQCQKKKILVEKKTTHDHFWVKNPYKNSACQNKKNEGGGVKFLNGYSLINFVLYVFAQPSWAAFFFIKLSFRKGRKRSCKPQNVMVETSKFENNFFLTMQD